MPCIWIGIVEPWEKAHSKSPSKVLQLLKNQSSEGVGTDPPWKPSTGTAQTLHVWHGICEHTSETVTSGTETHRAWGAAEGVEDSGLRTWTYEKELFVQRVPCESAGSFVIGYEPQVSVEEVHCCSRWNFQELNSCIIWKPEKASVYLNSGLHAVRVLLFKQLQFLCSFLRKVQSF